MRRRGSSLTRIVVWLCFGWAVFAPPRTAAADPPGPGALPVHVVSVKSDDALDQAEALTPALRKAVRDSRGWSLADSAQSLEYLAVKMGCAEPIDAACESRIAEVIRADRFLWAEIAFAPDDPKTVVGTLHFFVRGEGTQRTPLRYSANLDDAQADALVRVAREAVTRVTGGPPRGTLEIAAGGVAGQLFVDGEPVGALPAEGTSLPLPAGEHRIVVKAEGYQDAEASAVIVPSATANVGLTLVPIPPSTSVDGRMVAGFSAVGVGVATAAVGLWAALEVNAVRNDETWNDFRSREDPPISPAMNACDVAEAEGNTAIVNSCDRASRGELVQAVMFPVATIATGVGVYLLGTSSLFGEDEEAAGDDAPVATWQLSPIVTPDVQAMSLHVRF
ncbi:MAG: PEGA domain-containing protein [Myxococcota bacterium]